ncbi:MAG: tRNA pseudouridine(55) synthase TruB [Marinomonas sp.]|uniref:tRNA pseudouridine(55) synthase TruB n=1 Tax=Parasphingorhabdus sp. TaxID=2709688 RepID=UPI0032809ECC
MNQRPDPVHPAPNGWIILDKPRGLGSTQGVGAVKRNLREGLYARTKVGHGGTLDPLAEGVLPIALGEATKLAGRMLDATKIYEFTVQFGEQTDTLDTEGEIVETSDVRPSRDEVEAALPHFTGAIEQVPPIYSALKVDGKRAYDLARAGEEVELKTRIVTIHALTLVEHTSNSATLTAHVSKGTYIRSLARDIAHHLGTCGHVTYLRRTKAGPFAAKDAISLDKLNEIGSGAPLNDLLLPLEAGLDDIPALHLDQTDAQAVRAGRVLSDLPQSDGLYCGMLANVPVALIEIIAGTSKIVRGFNLPDIAK